MEYQSFLYCVYTVKALNFEHGVYLIVHVYIIASSPGLIISIIRPGDEANVYKREYYFNCFTFFVFTVSQP